MNTKGKTQIKVSWTYWNQGKTCFFKTKSRASPPPKKGRDEIEHKAQLQFGFGGY